MYDEEKKTALERMYAFQDDGAHKLGEFPAFARDLVREEALRVGVVAPVSFIDETIVCLRLDDDGVAEAARALVEEGTSLRLVLDERLADEEDHYVCDAEDFLELSSVLPDDFGEARLAVVLAAEVAAEDEGSYLASVVLAENVALEDVVETEYGDFDDEAMDDLVISSAPGSPWWSYDEDDRTFSAWTSEAMAEPLAGFCPCEHCGDDQVVVVDSLLLSTLLSLGDADGELVTAVARTTQRGFERGCENAWTDWETADTANVLIPEDEYFWHFLRCVVDGPATTVEDRGPDGVGGIVIRNNDEEFLHRLAEALAEQGLDVSADNIYAPEDAHYEYCLYLPPQCTRLVCDKAYRELESTPVHLDGEERIRGVVDDYLVFDEIGDPAKKELLYQA